MARPREFDTEAMLDKVMLAFLEIGLHSTSMRHLEKLTGVKQVSIYNAFGSKEGLYIAVFDRYADLAHTIQDRYMGSGGLEGIAAYTMAITSSESPLPHPQSGCLIVNTSFVAGEAGPVIKQRVQDFRQRMHARIVNAFMWDKSHGNLTRQLDMDESAEFIISIIWGIFITIRLAGDDQTVGRPAARAAAKTLRNWRLS